MRANITVEHAPYQRGFSLIEILVTVFIVGSLVALFSAALNLMRLTNDAKYTDIALRIASQKMEQERSVGYASTTSSSFTDPLLSELPQGRASTTVTDFNAKTKQLTVTVTWNGGATSTRTQELTTLITQIGGL